MATIKPIEGRSVHQIQSGQVISEGLTSVVKELVENGLDAHATSIEVRFKNNGLDAVEVIDNGDGVSPGNYESIALKHWTSKLSTYADLDSITTFGFRGEALSSLCALSDMQITTAMASEAPKGTRLEFEMSGRLKSRTVAAAQKGTTVLVENIFKTLPVRRKELERNIKREYTKVLGILQAYAGVCVGVKFSVFNQPTKGRRTPVFATKGNPTIRENISNVFGAKALSALVPMNLQFEMKPTRKGFNRGLKAEEKEVKIVGFISRPVVGEGRQAPDRQMFFVNGRPCMLPQVARAINEVYRHFNVTQSPFIFADIQLDTNGYDVNVSPDKRTILLHDQVEMMESLKVSLTELFDNHEQTVPSSTMGQSKSQAYAQLTLNRTHIEPSSQAVKQVTEDDSTEEDDSELYSRPTMVNNLGSSPLRTAAFGALSLRHSPAAGPKGGPPPGQGSDANGKGHEVEGAFEISSKTDELDATGVEGLGGVGGSIALPVPHLEAQSFMSQTATSAVPNSSFRSPRRPQQGQATITIGDRAPVTAGTVSPPSSPNKRRKTGNGPAIGKTGKLGISKFSSSLNRFAAAGSRLQLRTEDDGDLEGSPESGHRMEDEEDSSETLMNDESDVAGNMMIDDEQDGSTEVAGVIPVEPPEVDTGPLFLPDPILDAEPDAEPDEDPQVDETTLEFEAADDDGDGCVDKDYVDEDQNRKESAQKAEQLLKEAEDNSTEPASEALEKAFRILEDPHKLSTKNSVRFVSTSIKTLRDRTKDLSRSCPTGKYPSPSGQSKNFLDEQDEVAEERLNLTVSKQDFFEMKIKGQFNRGFILATRGDDLFIIDQHASDEKYNFEKLQQETVVQNQRLVVPKSLDLMAMDEIIVMDHLNTFKKNGFAIEADPYEPVGSKCKLISLPMSKGTIFGLDDLEELIHLINEDPGNSAVRCSKVRKMFAMRACRKSVMVGKALPRKGMEKIVRHMGELDKPWNCPHGRPTMRHMTDLGQAGNWKGPDQEREGGLKWGSESWAETSGIWGA